MNILQLNKYITLNGGSETVMKNISEIFSANKHSVINVGFAKEDQPFITKNVISLGNENLSVMDMFKNNDIVKKIINIIIENEIDLVICHNIYHHFPILDLLKSIKSKTNAKIVMYLHDYKVVCPIYSLLHDGVICEKCSNKSFYSVTKNKCKDNSILKSGILYLESFINNKILDAYKYSDIFISPSLFLRSKVMEMGFKKKIEVLHNPVKGYDSLNDSSIDFNTVLYAGRLSEEKGIGKFIEVIKDTPNIKYKIAGGGPLTDSIKELSTAFSNVEYLGYLSQKDLSEAMTNSSFLYIPSIWYENNPMIVLEAMSKGLPVIGSNYGGIPELLNDGRGFVLDVDNIKNNVKQLNDIMKITDDEYIKVRKKAKQFTDNLSYKKYYEDLVKILEENNLWQIK